MLISSINPFNITGNNKTRCKNTMTKPIGLTCDTVSFSGKNPADEIENEQEKRYQFIEAFNTGNDEKSESILKDAEELLLNQDKKGNTGLIAAAQNGKTNLVRGLLGTAPSDEIKTKALTMQDNLGFNALMSAAILGDAETVNLLFELAPNNETRQEMLNQQDKLGDTALTQAVRTGNADMIKILVNAAPNKEEILLQKGSLESSALLCAALSSDPQLTETILGLAPNDEIKTIMLLQQDDLGNSALIQAVDCENPELVKILLDSAPNDETKAKMLLQQDDLGNSALIQAVLYKNPELVITILESAPNVETKQKMLSQKNPCLGLTAGMLAARQAASDGNYDIVDLLEQA